MSLSFSWVVVFTSYMCNLMFNISFMSFVIQSLIYSFTSHLSFCIVLALVLSLKPLLYFFLYSNFDFSFACNFFHFSS